MEGPLLRQDPPPSPTGVPGPVVVTLDHLFTFFRIYLILRGKAKWPTCLGAYCCCCLPAWAPTAAAAAACLGAYCCRSVVACCLPAGRQVNLLLILVATLGGGRVAAAWRRGDNTTFVWQCEKE